MELIEWSRLIKPRKYLEKSFKIFDIPIYIQKILIDMFIAGARNLEGNLKRK